MFIQFITVAKSIAQSKFATLAKSKFVLATRLRDHLKLHDLFGLSSCHQNFLKIPSYCCEELLELMAYQLSWQHLLLVLESAVIFAIATAQASLEPATSSPDFSQE